MLVGFSDRLRQGLMAARLARSAGSRDFSPNPAVALADAPLLAIDLETTGLDPASDRIVSFGWVPVDGLVVTTSGAVHQLVAQPNALPRQTVVVHGITDQQVAGALPLDEAIDRFITAACGRTLLAHHAPVEARFLQAAFRSLKRPVPPLVSLDTLEIERARRAGRTDADRQDSLRLPVLRAAYGLPAYHSHHALGDALACAELLLAQAAHGGLGRRTIGGLGRFWPGQ